MIVRCCISAHTYELLHKTTGAVSYSFLLTDVSVITLSESQSCFVASHILVLSLHLCRQRRNVDLRDLLAISVEAAVLGGREVKPCFFDRSMLTYWLSSQLHLKSF